MAPRNRAPAEKAERLKDVLHGSAAIVNDPKEEADMKSSSGLSRMVDMRIPLVWLLGLLGGFALMQIIMWFTVQELNRSMNKVQATLEVSTAQTQTFREELAVQKFRLTNIDAEIAALKAARYQDSMRTPR